MKNTKDLIETLLSRGLSQAEIVRRTGIPQPKLSRWASGPPGSADDALKLLELVEKTRPNQASDSRP